MNKRATVARTKNNVETMKQFRQLIMNSMGKMKDGHTTQTALEEIKEIMRVHVTSTDRMNSLISIFADQNEHMGITQRKEGLKLFGIMGEVFEDSLLPFVPKILSICQKKSEDPQLHVAISDSLGIMVHHIFKHLVSPSDKVSQLSNIVNQLISCLRNTARNVQIGTGMCLTRVVQNSPIEALVAILEPFTDSLLELIQSPSIKCTTQVLETLISLVLAVEYEFEPYARKFVPALVESMQNPKDWGTRKMAIDVIYTFAAFLPDAIVPIIDYILKALKERKSDKIRHVREAAQEALAKINEARKKSGKPLNEYAGKGTFVEESKQVVSSEGSGKSIFHGPMNPNFFKAAPKNAIEIVTSSPKGRELEENFADLEENRNVEEHYAVEYLEEQKEQEIPKEELDAIQEAYEDIKGSVVDIPKGDTMEEQHMQQIEEEDKVRMEEDNINEVLVPEEPQPVAQIETAAEAVETMPPGSPSTYQFDLNKIAKQQLRLIESMNSFQTMTRKEISMLQDRMSYIEQLVEKISKAVDKAVDRSATSYPPLYRPEELSVRSESLSKTKKTDDVWSKVLDYVKAKRYNEAYSWILGKKDDAQLVRLMGKTGIVIEQLDGQNVEYLLTKAVDLVKAREFVDLLLAWMVAAVDRKVNLSLNIQSAMLEALGGLLGLEGTEEYRLDEVQISEVNRVYNILKASLSSFNNA